MHFEPDALFHIYNRSNETIFFTRENYLFFLRKIQKHIQPYCNILAWVLMPNHFHLLVQAKKEGCKNVETENQLQVQVLSKNFGTLLSSYTQAINKQQARRGKLFSHNTKAKDLNEETLINSMIGLERFNHFQMDYATACFLYIHQNPIMSGLVSNLEDWEFSSYRDYAGLRDGKLVQKALAREIIDLDFDDFVRQSQYLVEEELLKKLFY